MKCNVKEHLLDRNVFGEVFPTFRGKQRKGKYKETEEAKRKMEKRNSIQSDRQLDSSGKSE